MWSRNCNGAARDEARRGSRWPQDGPGWRQGLGHALPLRCPRREPPAGTCFPPVTLLHGPVRGAAGLAARQTGGRVSAPLLTGTQSWGCCLSSLSLGFPLALQIFDDYNALPPSRAFEGPHAGRSARRAFQNACFLAHPSPRLSPCFPVCLLWSSAPVFVRAEDHGH